MNPSNNQLLQKAMRMQSQGKTQEAAKLYRKIVSSDVNNITALYNYGVILHQMGRREEALRLLQKTVTLAVDFPEAHLSVGLVHMEMGALDKAVDHFKHALTLKPTLERAYFRLGEILWMRQDHASAVEWFQKSLRLRPEDPHTLFFLGNALYGSGRFAEALPVVRHLVRLKPEEPMLALRLLAQCLTKVVFTKLDADLVPEILHLLHAGAAVPSELSDTFLSVLRLEPDIQALMDMARDHAQMQHAVQQAFQGGPSLPGLDHPLFLVAMKTNYMADAAFQQMLARLRNQFLHAASDNPAGLDLAGHPVWLLALARQCFINEYLFPQSDEETHLLSRLEASLQQALDQGMPLSWGMLGLVGTYRPLHALDQAERLLTTPLPELARQEVTIQVAEPLEEHRLQTRITSLTPIDNRVSQAVRDQYETNPYPRWTEIPYHPVQDMPWISVIQKLFPHWRSQAHVLETDQPLNILIAGCGTGRHAIHVARMYRHASVLAVDLSLASLGYAERMTRQLGITTIRYHQADILHLGMLEERFSIIESVGVLHHMEDPVAGWRVLLDRLQPGGVMKIGLYSQAARRHIVAVRQFIQQHGFASTLAGIRQCREAILSRPPDDPIRQVVRDRDFYSTSTCRDLIFHQQEHQFTLPHIQTILETLGLSFIGFEFEDPRIQMQYADMFPDDVHRTNLSNWHRFEQKYPETFLNMYQFWVERQSCFAPGCLETVSFG